ncbi:MAG: peptidoglycan DD-metalloendopeptidase family protein [Proteobacteria bacterium]|nr:peptidoglycan DD-metalloendopeptidase family protein [Pseudomonadota bacterium]
MRFFFSILLIFLFIYDPILASNTDKEAMEELKRKIQIEKKQIEELTYTEKYLTMSLGEIRKKLKELKDRIKNIEISKKRVEKELLQLEGEKNKIIARINGYKREIEKRIILWHKTYLLKNDIPTFNFEENLMFENYMTSIFKYDKRLIERLQEQKNNLDINISSTEKKRKELILVQKELDEAKKEQEILERRQKELLGKTIKEKNIHIRNLKKAEEALRRLESLIKKAEEAPEYEGRGLEKRVLPYPVKGEIVGHFGVEEGDVKGAKFTRKGVEISAADGAAVRAVDDGKLVYEGWIKGLGNICIISHGKSFYTVYGRLSKVTKNRGDEVKKGEIIGYVTKSASIYDFPTLYFEIREKNKPLNPELWLR